MSDLRNQAQIVSPDGQPPQQMPQAAQVPVPAAPAQPQVAPQVQSAPQQDFRRNPSQQELDDDDALYQADLDAGRITPETYKSLFAKKDTLGKIGTIFGLMLGGAGAGLTKGPNVALEMMNKEIENDLQAQRASKEAQRNFVKLHQEHDLNRANIKQKEFENLLTMAGAQKASAETSATLAGIAGLEGLTREKNRLLQDLYKNERLLSQNSEISAENGARNKMMSSAYQYMKSTVDQMPPGPQKEQAMQMLQNVMAPAISQQIQQNNARTVFQTNFNDDQAMMQIPPQEGDESPIDFNKMQRKINLGKSGGDIPGSMGPAEQSAANAEAARVMENRAIAKKYVEAFRNLDEAFAAGRLNQAYRDAQVAILAAEIARSTTGMYNQKEAEQQANGMIPEWKDYGKARDAKFSSTMDFFEKQEAGTPTLNRFGLKRPFPKYSRFKGSGKEGQRITSKSGRSMIFRNGKWEYESGNKPTKVGATGGF